MMFLKSLGVKIAGIISAVASVFFMLWRKEKSEREVAEQIAETEKANREHMEKREEVITDLDEHREAQREIREKDARKTAQDLQEAVKQEDKQKAKRDMIDIINRGLDKDE